MTWICEFCFYSAGNNFIADKWVMEATVMGTWRMVKHGCMDSGREILDRLRGCRIRDFCESSPSYKSSINSS